MHWLRNFFLTFIPFILMGLYWLVAQHYQQTAIAHADHNKMHAPITIKNVILKEHEKKKNIVLTMKADESRFNHISDTLVCTNITCLIEKNKQEIGLLKAEQSILYKPAKTVFLAGKLHGTIQDLSLQGQDFSYSFSDHIITTNKNIKLQHAHGTLQAPTCIIDMNKNSITLSGGVVSEFTR